MKPLRLAGLAALAALTLGTARAQENSGAEATVQALMARASSALQTQDYDAALESFQRAHDLIPRPVMLYNIGMCYRAKVDWPSALQAFRQYLADGRETEPAERLAEVERLMAEMEADLATVTIRIPQPGAHVLLDGSEIGRAPLADPLLLRSGVHVFEARLDGYADARTELTLAGAEQRTVELVLTPLLPLPPPPVQEGSGGTGGMEIGFWTSVGLTGAAVVAAAVTGGLMLSNRSDYLDGGRLDRDRYDTTLDLALATDVLMGVAAAAAVAASVLTYFAWFAEDDVEEQPDVGLLAAPGSLVLTW